MTLKQIRHIFQETLEGLYVKEEIDSFFYLLIDAYFNISRIQLAINPDCKVDSNLELLNALELLKKQKPIQYILGETEFYGLPFKVREHVLIPRPETEELVTWVINHTKGSQSINILDIGTGSGCIAITLAKKIPKAKVCALDVSVEALQIAKQNAALNNVEIDFIEASILNSETWSSVFLNSKFDIIVSNPPYVRELEKLEMKTNVLDNEPHLALFVKDENPLVFYEAISNFAKMHLNDNGLLFFEINEYLGTDMVRLLNEKGFLNIELKQDLFKKDRMLKGCKGVL